MSSLWVQGAGLYIPAAAVREEAPVQYLGLLGRRTQRESPAGARAAANELVEEVTPPYAIVIVMAELSRHMIILMERVIVTSVYFLRGDVFLFARRCMQGGLCESKCSANQLRLRLANLQEADGGARRERPPGGRYRL